MKRVFALLLAALLLLALVACGVTVTPSDGPGNADTTAKPSGDTPGTDNGGKTDGLKGVDAWYAENGLNLPTNMYYEYTLSIMGGKVWKIGDEFVTYSLGDYSYYRFEDGIWKEYIQDYDGNWTWMDYGDENPVVSPGLCSFLKERKGFNGKQNYYTATSETKEFFGKTCVKYHEDLLGSLYVDESTGLFFQQWMDGAESAYQEITVWDETVTEFPIAVPSK